MRTIIDGGGYVELREDKIYLGLAQWIDAVTFLIKSNVSDYRTYRTRTGFWRMDLYDLEGNFYFRYEVSPLFYDDMRRLVELKQIFDEWLYLK